jgi:cyclopropane fatty-acyl-phospholipid synthase-like methyltransferase
MISLSDLFSSNPALENKGGYFSQKNNNFNSFEDLYFALRLKEKRVYSDIETKILPTIHPDHSHFNEWKIRENSLNKLIKYLRNKEIKTILEIGCGNGWIANQLACNLDVEVCAVDINAKEIAQACSVFRNKKINFLQIDVFSKILPQNQFDIIILAGSIQYFPDLSRLISTSKLLLSPIGEIHLFDSPLYAPDAIREAKSRSKNYFDKMGFPEMTANYFHHSITELNRYNVTYRHNPSSVYHRITKALFHASRSPFPWVIIKKN